MSSGTASLLAELTTALAALYIAVLALRSSAKPALLITHRSSGRELPAARRAYIVFTIRNRGHWFGAPPANDVDVYLNFAPPAEIECVRFGSALEREAHEPRVGKGLLRYIKAGNIRLVGRGRPEHLVAWLITPEQPGDYTGEVTAISAEGAEATLAFSYRVA